MNKKSILNYLLLLIVLVFSITLAGCDLTVTEVKRLDTPRVFYNDNYLRWAEVQHADSYIVKYDSIEVEVYNTYFSTEEFEEGTYYFTVVALDSTEEYLQSKESKRVTVQISAPVTPGPDPIIPVTPEVDDERNGYVNVLSINDTHGAFDKTNYPSIAQVASVIEEVEATNGKYIKIADGDIFQGGYVSNVLYGKPLMEALNVLKFDCFVIGNHEFDWGFDKIYAYKDGDLSNGEANYPFLACNINYKATNSPVEWLEPYTIVENHGVKVGIIGYIGETMESSISYEYVVDYDFVDPVPLIEEYVYELRTQKDCDVVICAGHVYDTDVNNRIAQLSGSYAVDAIICAHTHQLIHDDLTRSDGKKIAAVQNDDKNEALTTLRLRVNDDNQYQSYLYQYYRPQNYSESATLEPLMNKYSSYINESKRVLGTTSSNISKSTIGSYCIKVMEETFKADVAIINTGGVRGTISRGQITVSAVYEVYPFSNEVITTTMTGSSLKTLLNRNGDYLYYTNISLNNTKSYKVAVIDYVYNGTYYSEFRLTVPTHTNILLRDLLVDYIDDLYN